ncbi:hypothetical protein C8K63_11660 [Pseudomonas sp. GV085]|nr:hypothetical protein C8K63_11660 [Pseudomonas sp. GV085]
MSFSLQAKINSFASRPPQLDWVHPEKIDRLTGRHRSDAATRQASSHKKISAHPLCFSPLIRPSVSSPAAVDLDAPISRGRVEVLRSGQPGMDAGLAAHGHEWPIAAGPVGASLLAKNLRAPRGVRLPASSLTSIASNRASTGCSYRPGGVPFFQVTRCKSKTNSSRDHRNGYVHRSMFGVSKRDTKAASSPTTLAGSVRRLPSG